MKSIAILELIKDYYFCVDFFEIYIHTYLVQDEGFYLNKSFLNEEIFKKNLGLVNNLLLNENISCSISDEICFLEKNKSVNNVTSFFSEIHRLNILVFFNKIIQNIFHCFIYSNMLNSDYSYLLAGKNEFLKYKDFFETYGYNYKLTFNHFSFNVKPTRPDSFAPYIFDHPIDGKNPFGVSYAEEFKISGFYSLEHLFQLKDAWYFQDYSVLYLKIENFYGRSGFAKEIYSKPVFLGYNKPIYWNEMLTYFFRNFEEISPYTGGPLHVDQDSNQSDYSLTKSQYIHYVKSILSAYEFSDKSFGREYNIVPFEVLMFNEYTKLPIRYSQPFSIFYYYFFAFDMVSIQAIDYLIDSLDWFFGEDSIPSIQNYILNRVIEFHNSTFEAQAFHYLYERFYFSKSTFLIYNNFMNHILNSLGINFDVKFVFSYAELAPGAEFNIVIDPLQTKLLFWLDMAIFENLFSILGLPPFGRNQMYINFELGDYLHKDASMLCFFETIDDISKIDYNMFIVLNEPLVLKNMWKLEEFEFMPDTLNFIKEIKDYSIQKQEKTSFEKLLNFYGYLMNIPYISDLYVTYKNFEEEYFFKFFLYNSFIFDHLNNHDSKFIDLTTLRYYKMNTFSTEFREGLSLKWLYYNDFFYFNKKSKIMENILLNVYNEVNIIEYYRHLLANFSNLAFFETMESVKDLDLQDNKNNFNTELISYKEEIEGILRIYSKSFMCEDIFYEFFEFEFIQIFFFFIFENFTEISFIFFIFFQFLYLLAFFHYLKIKKIINF